MALYVLLHHQRDSNQPWVNAWLDDERIEAIQTTKEIGKLCRKAQDGGERVLVHRCGWNDFPPVICCSAAVEMVADIDRSTTMVRFANPTPTIDLPPKIPVKGQNFYIC